METGTEALAASLDRSRTLLLIVAIASLLAAGGIGVFYVRRHLVRRLIAIGNAMRRLSSGDVDLRVPATADRDEIGEMARALEVFRDGEIERRSYADRQSAAQAAEHEHAAAINQIIGDFRGTITGVIRTVADNVSRMEAHRPHAVRRRPRGRRAGARGLAFLRDDLGQRQDRRRRRRSARRIRSAKSTPRPRRRTASFTAPPRSRDRPTNWSGNCRPAPTGSATSSC